MASRIIAVGALGVACVLAAGGGAYLAVRQNRPAAEPTTAASVPVSQGQQQSSALGTAAGLVTAPPSATETAATQSPASALEPNSAEPPENHNAARLSRRSDSERRTKAARHEAAEADRPGGVTPDGSAARPEQAAGTGDQPVAVPPLQPVAPPPEPQHEFVDVTVPAESVLGLQVQTPVSSDTARVEDRVEARVTRDVRVGDRVAIPAGAQVLGSVVQVDRGGKVKDRAQFAIRFHTLIMPDGTRTQLTAEALHREGPSPAGKSAAKIGGATVGGAILGAILGGGKGAAIGGGIGAAGGTAATMAGDRQPATLPAGSIVNVRLMAPVTVTLER